MQNEKTGLVPIAQAANLLMVSDERVRQLIKTGYVARASRGMVGLVPVIQGYIRSLLDARARTEPTAQASAVARARAEEIRFRVERETLIATIEAEDAIADILDTLAAGFAELGDVAGWDAALRRRIEQARDAILARARRDLAEWSTDVRSRDRRRRR